MIPSNEPASWQVRLLGPRLPWGGDPIRPAEVAAGLCEAALERQNLLEDASYHKIAPNLFVVELEQENYTRNYQPLERQILEQWKERLLNHLLTVNSRQGRQEYRFAGPVSIELRPAQNLKLSQARILSRIQADAELPRTGARQDLAACLEAGAGGRRWPVHPGVVTIGREATCEVYLDAPEVQRKKLVSGRHAYLVCREGSCRLFDGSPDGRPSLNGTFVNLQRVPAQGVELKDGDQILLAALNPSRPNPGAPGAATLYYRALCPHKDGA